MMVRSPILIDIRKDRVLIKELCKTPVYNDDLFIWTQKNYDKEKIISIGYAQDLQGEGVFKNKVFFNRESMLIDRFDLASIALKSLIYQAGPKGLRGLVRPTLIINIPYEISATDKNDLKELAELVGTREAIILNEKRAIQEELIQPNRPIPYKVVSEADRFETDYKLILALSTLVLVWFGIGIMLLA